MKQSRDAAEWNRANPDRHRANKRSSHARNREHYNAITRDYRHANLERHRERFKAWRKANPEYERTRSLAEHGLTPDDYDSMFEMQEGRCAICRTTKPGGRWDRFAVDHCHRTGKVRSLLCHRCNTAIGLLDDNSATARRAADYLDHFNSEDAP